MLAALTVLPAALSRLGRAHRPPSRRERANPREPGAAPRGFWASWGQRDPTPPWPGALAGLAIMLVLAAPVLALRLGNSDAGNNPPSDTTRQAYDLIAKGFGPGSNGPLEVVASLPQVGDRAALARVAGTLKATANVASVSPARLNPSGQTAVFNVYRAARRSRWPRPNLCTRCVKTVLPAGRAQHRPRPCSSGASRPPRSTSRACCPASCLCSSASSCCSPRCCCSWCSARW